MRLPREAHFDGTLLWGNDFDASERQDWFSDEENAYLELYAANPGYEYEYEAVNRRLGFQHLPSERRFKRVLGLGSAYGDELLPLADRIDSAVIVESADGYTNEHHLPFQVAWRKADPSGDLPLSNREADLVVCLGVLHHVPNVQHVVHEMGRVTELGGHALIREPIISMGDWTKPRAGLTPRERGIPRALLQRFAEEAGFEVVAEELCFFPGTRIIAKLARRDPFVSDRMVRLDRLLSKSTAWNYRYHATSKWQKVRPTASFLVLRKLA